MILVEINMYKIRSPIRDVIFSVPNVDIKCEKLFLNESKVEFDESSFYMNRMKMDISSLKGFNGFTIMFFTNIKSLRDFGINRNYWIENCLDLDFLM